MQKIPDWILLKEALKEVGKLKAYIDELEDENAALKAQRDKQTLSLKKEIKKLKKLSKGERNQLNRDAYVSALQKKVKEQTSRIKKLNNRFQNMRLKELRSKPVSKLIMPETKNQNPPQPPHQNPSSSSPPSSS